MNKKRLLLACMLVTTIGVTAQQLPFQNPNLPTEQRIDDLLQRLTLEEKASLMMNESPAIKRLGVPRFEWWNEALHGVGRNGFATVFPITTGMAASWDDQLVEQVFTAVSDEARAKNTLARRNGTLKKYAGLSFWTPNINIFRDPRWGRGQETYGEDPFLTSRMGTAVVRGLQGPKDSKYRKLLACAKHFAVHSGPEWNRHTFNIENLPERDLWETYLPAFKALVDEGVAEVMCAYQRIDGEPCCAQNRYEHQILRQDWGFRGLITSDCGAIWDFLPDYHNVSPDAVNASAKAVRAGTDVECGNAYRKLPEAVRRGELSEQDIDRSLRRLLRARFELGDMDPDELVEWTRIPTSVIASKKHKQLALQVAREGIVLLKNNGVLPLTSSLVVMGPNANDSVMMWGNYAGYPTQTTTILQGIRQRFGQDVKYIPGCGITSPMVTESHFNLLRTPDGRQGMVGTYWNNETMEGQPVANVVYTEPINLSNGGATVFAPGVELNHFSARYEATLRTDRDIKLELFVGADDMMRLYVDGDTLVDVWKSRNRIQEGTVELDFKAGRDYHILVDYKQTDDMAAMQFDVRRRYTPSTADLLSQIGQAETVVFAGGISPRVEGEQMKVSDPGFKGGDRTTIELPEVQRQLLRTLHEAGKRVVFVNCSGGAVALEPEARETCDAIVQAWYGGEAGGQALAEVLSGDVNPSGKLPMTFYRDDSQLPDFLDYRMAGRTYRYLQSEPLFAFGHGLSYTTFNVSKQKAKVRDGKLIVTCTVENTGAREGTETVQVYLRRTADVEGPLKTLRGYQRVTLKPGEKKVVALQLTRDELETWDPQTNTMRVVPGQHEVMVGTSSAASQLKTLRVKL